MRRQVVTGALGTVLAVGPILTALVAPAAARTRGKESFKGTIVASGETGARTVVDSVIVAKGVFRRAGRIVEVPSRPGDPDTVSRDDLVFGRGKMHLVSTSGAAVTSLNRNTCVFNVSIPQTGKIQGGTGRFRHASGSFTGAVRTRGVAARNLDGTCSQDQPPLLEVDVVTGRGTLSF